MLRPGFSKEGGISDTGNQSIATLAHLSSVSSIHPGSGRCSEPMLDGLC